MSEENFVSDVVDKLKKQGLFDRFRKECLADVDTKPAYQNLQLRVKEAVGKYLHGLKWKSDLNKNQLRENLRRHLNELPMLTNGIDRVVEQVVKPKIMKSLKPQIDRVVCEHMNVDYEQWLSDQNDSLKRKQVKAEEAVAPPSTLPIQCTAAVTPPFPPVITVTVPVAPAILTSAPPPIINDIQLPPPPPPPSFEEPNDLTSSPPNPPPPPPPLPSDASEDDSSIPAPPPDPDVRHSVSSPPPLPPDDDDVDLSLPPRVEEIIVEEDLCSHEDEVFVKSSDAVKTRPSDPLEESNTAGTNTPDRVCDSIARNTCGKMDAVGHPSDNRSLNDSFSNDNSFPFPDVEIVNADGKSKEYRFAWNNFNESDLSNISVSSVHTSDLSNFEGDEDLDTSLKDPDQSGSKNHSQDGDMSKDSDSKQSASIRHSLNESMHESLDTSNASFNSFGRKRTKKEELKERKMEEKKEMKRQRVLNRRYCSEEFMSIFSDKKHLQEKHEEEITKDQTHLASTIDADEEVKVEDNASDLENAYSPYSNISEASSDSVVVLGVELAKTKKGKKSKSRKRSRSSDGNRKKKKRRRHKSSRRSSRHCSGGDEEQEDVPCQPKQDGIKAKSSAYEFDNNSSKGYPDEELLADDYFMNDLCNDATKKKTKKSVDRINFGEAERQAAAFRMTAGGKQPPFPVTSPTWQKQTFGSPPRSSRQRAHSFVGQPNFSPMAATADHKLIRHAQPLYHQQQITMHPMHDTRVYDRTKHSNESDSYRHSRNVSKKPFHVEDDGDDIGADDNGFKRIKRNDAEEKARHPKPAKCIKLASDEFPKDSRQHKKQSDYFETRNKR